MKPSAVALDFSTGHDSDEYPSRASSDFEEIPYPNNYRPASSKKEEELPLHYMSEEKARRRTARGAGGGYDDEDEGVGAYNGAGYVEKTPRREEYDDQGKDVYSKVRPINNRMGSGRLPQPPTPPATNLVRGIAKTCLP
jgi:dolichyl-phosphate-mannose-protein mannosyltransferase